mgnify:FL=1
MVVTANMRVPTVPEGDSTVQVQFQIQNTGGGRAFTSAEDDNTITIKGAGADCGTGAGADKTVRLAGGKSATVFCKFNVGSVTTFVEKSFSIGLKYNYFIDSATQVTVLKKPVE